VAGSRIAQMSGRADLLAMRLYVLVFAAFVLASCGNRAQTPADVVERFYTTRIESNATGAPAAEDLKKFAPYISEELRVLLEQARRRNDDEVAAAPGDKPSFADGDLFSSLFEGPDSFEVGADEATGDLHRISVQFAYNRQQPVLSWTDKAVVKTENGRPVIADIEYGGNWEFGNKGTLVSMLKNALTPAAAASVLGNWAITGHRIPGASAMNDAQATLLHGQVLKYAAETATSGKDVCPHVTYRTASEPAEKFLAAGFRIKPESLGLPATDAKLDIIEVSCGGVPWTTLGGILLQTGRHAFAPWNGVFFELQRR
jgi:hypothetical protein